MEIMKVSSTSVPNHVAGAIASLMREKEKIIIPVWRKVTMTVEEAAAYSSIGINKIREMLKIPNCPFVLYIGNKKLVKRREFENYIEGNIEL